MTAVCLFFIGYQLSGQGWQMTTGIHDSIWINDIITVDNYVYAATESSIFRSDNYGESWEPKNGGTHPGCAQALSYSGGNIYIASVIGVFISDDYGETWFDMPAPEGIYSLVFADDSIIIACSSGGTYRSSDYGYNWTDVGIEPLFKTAKYQNKYFADSWSGILVSEDYGLTWESTDISNTYWVINCSDMIYACPFSGGL